MYSQDLLKENNNFISKTFNLFQLDRTKLKTNILLILEKYNFTYSDIMKMQYYDLHEYIDLINDINKKIDKQREDEEKRMDIGKVSNSFKIPSSLTNTSAIMNRFK